MMMHIHRNVYIFFSYILLFKLRKNLFYKLLKDEKCSNIFYAIGWFSQTFMGGVSDMVTNWCDTCSHPQHKLKSCLYLLNECDL